MGHSLTRWPTNCALSSRNMVTGSLLWDHSMLSWDDGTCGKKTGCLQFWFVLLLRLKPFHYPEKQKSLFSRGNLTRMVFFPEQNHCRKLLPVELRNSSVTWVWWSPRIKWGWLLQQLWHGQRIGFNGHARRRSGTLADARRHRLPGLPHHSFTTPAIICWKACKAGMSRIPIPGCWCSCDARQFTSLLPAPEQLQICIMDLNLSFPYYWIINSSFFLLIFSSSILDSKAFSDSCLTWKIVINSCKNIAYSPFDYILK